jgi:hypothetical protein
VMVSPDLASKPVVMVSPGLVTKQVVMASLSLTSKPVATGFPVWASNPAATVWSFVPQNHHDGFLFGPQNHVGYGLSVMPQNQWEDEDGVGNASRSSGLLLVEASWVRVSQSGLKSGGGATVGGACGIIIKVVLRSS